MVVYSHVPKGHIQDILEQIIWVTFTTTLVLNLNRRIMSMLKPDARVANAASLLDPIMMDLCGESSCLVGGNSPPSCIHSHSLHSNGSCRLYDLPLPRKRHGSPSRPKGNTPGVLFVFCFICFYASRIDAMGYL